jgi:hypothetical protein
MDADVGVLVMLAVFIAKWMRRLVAELQTTHPIV